MQTRIRSLKNWEKLDINNIERRKILCSVTFHLIVITCVIWSLYVLIERTAHEMSLNQLDWAFWVKLVVVAIGFTGGVVFMYIQCKMYVQLCMRWRRYNRVIIIQPITEELLISNTNQRRNPLPPPNSNCDSSIIKLPLHPAAYQTCCELTDKLIGPNSDLAVTLATLPTVNNLPTTEHSVVVIDLNPTTNNIIDTTNHDQSTQINNNNNNNRPNS